MKDNSVTQAQLATALNCSQTAVSHLLSGKTRLTIDDLCKIASALEVSVETLVSEAAQSNQVTTTLSPEAEGFVCSNAVAFYIFNYLKKPTPLKDLLDHFDHSRAAEVRDSIQKMKNLGIVLEDISGCLKTTLPDPTLLQYRLTPEYADRIVEIYQALRPVVLHTAQSPELIPKWKEKNLDAFYIEFFTDEQLKQQNQAFRQALDLVKHHIRLNRNDPTGGSRKSTELRVIFMSMAPCPVSQPKGTSQK